MASIRSLKRSITRAIGIAFVGLSAALGTTAMAQDGGAFPKGDITMVVSSAPGGGTDLIARVFGAALSRQLPGRPTMIYNNMGAAGGVAALNYFYIQGKPDGRSLVVGAANQLNPINLGREQIKYDPTRFVQIGGFSNPSSFLFIHNKSAKRLKDKSAPPIQMATVDGLRVGDLMARWADEYLGWNVRLVFGYPGTQEMLLAFQRGEVDMAGNNNLDLLDPIMKKGDVQMLLQTGMLDKGKVLPSPEFPNVPIFDDVIQGKLSGLELEAFEVWRRQSWIGKWFALAPGTPDSIATIYREAFARVVQDPEFLKVVQTRVSPDFGEMTHKDLEEVMKYMADSAKKPELVRHFEELAKKR
jgi:tripartite-type tricarboxylate transporter receptor subunit TctC